MGTRSITRIMDDDGKSVLTCIYRKMDGYPTGHGADLKKIVAGMVIVNGIRMDEKRPIANGMGCLAAQVVAALKNGPGSIYIYPADAEPEEYVYTLRPASDNFPCAVMVKVETDGEVLYNGTADDFDPATAEAQ